jgi:hypothetical protein
VKSLRVKSPVSSSNQSRVRNFENGLMDDWEIDRTGDETELRNFMVDGFSPIKVGGGLHDDMWLEHGAHEAARSIRVLSPTPIGSSR